jgi:3-phosphoglycerate kinase
MLPAALFISKVGDSVGAVKQFGFENKVSYVSTGGGAMLEMLKEHCTRNQSHKG